MLEAVVRFEQVSYLYPQSKGPVLQDLTLEIQRGEFLGLIGPTGAGKSTFCLCLNGLVPQFYGGRFFGRITVAGLDTLEHPISALARHVGAVFEDPESQLLATSVENEIAFALENLKVPREEIRARIPRVLEVVRLSGMEKKHPFELSSGQKQRLAIAAALAVQPDLLVLDEPTSQLDPIGAQEVFATLCELNEYLGMTIVLAGHASEEMAEHASRIAWLSSGRLVGLDKPDVIYAQVERLQNLYLRPPQVTATFYLLQQKHLPIPQLPIRLEEGRVALKKAIESAEVAPPPALPLPSLRKGSPLLAVKDLHFTYPDGTQALHGVSLDIYSGEYILIGGQNGAGKSTLVKHFLNLHRPTSGSVTIHGTETSQLSVSALAREVGYVAQNPDSQIFNSRVEDEVAFALKHLGFSGTEINARVESSLEAMGLIQSRQAHPLALPKGDRARVVIAAILAMQPEIIIFDEPTTGQDFLGASQILNITRQLHQAGKTIIVITHHLYLMPAYAERVLLLGEGTLLLDAPLRAAFHNTPVLRSTFLAPPQAVQLAQELARLQNHPYPLLTPEEIAACFSARQN